MPQYTWQHLVVANTGTTVKMYLNNALVLNTATSMNTTSDALTIGAGELAGDYGAGPLIGAMDEFRIYNRELTTTEIAALYAAGTCSGGNRICDATCVNVLTDANNCGRCGNVCGGACTAGSCSGNCPAGKSQCSGYCVDLQNDINNCGTCGHACGTDDTANAGVACNSGICSNEVSGGGDPEEGY